MTDSILVWAGVDPHDHKIYQVYDDLFWQNFDFDPTQFRHSASGTFLNCPDSSPTVGHVFSRPRCNSTIAISISSITFSNSMSISMTFTIHPPLVYTFSIV